jgi:hypothetical protein
LSLVLIGSRFSFTNIGLLCQYVSQYNSTTLCESNLCTTKCSLFQFPIVNGHVFCVSRASVCQTSTVGIFSSLPDARTQPDLLINCLGCIQATVLGLRLSSKFFCPLCWQHSMEIGALHCHCPSHNSRLWTLKRAPTSSSCAVFPVCSVSTRLRVTRKLCAVPAVH